MLVVYYIARRESDSSIISLVSFVNQIGEGFDSPASTAIKCKSGWTFFANAKGQSFCCGGSVNPYGAVCETPEKLCSWAPRVPDPRGPAYGMLPICKNT